MAKPKFNPYIIGSPVHGAAFYGREKLVNVVETALAVKTVNLLVFYGQRRMGKTSLLQNLSLRSELADNFVFVFTDTVDVYSRKSYEVLSYFTHKISEVVHGVTPLSSADLQANTTLFQSSFLPVVYQTIGKQKRLVILLDEFDIFEYRAGKLDPSSPESALRTIEQLIRHETDLAFIAAVGRGQEYGYRVLDQVLRTGHWAKVSLLEEEDAYRLITEPVGNALAYQPEVVEEIWNLTAGHPYYTQLVCYEIFNRLQTEQGTEIRASDVHRAAAKTLETGSGGFGWLWEGLSPAEQLMVSLIAETGNHTPDHTVTDKQLEAAFEENRINQRGPEFTEALKRLVNLDILQQSGPLKNIKYRYIVEIVRQWVGKEHPIPQERDKLLPQISTRAVAEFEKGEKAADSQTALESYRSAVAANPNHLQAQLALGQVLEDTGLQDEALSAFEAALWLDPHNIKAKSKIQHLRPESEFWTPSSSNRAPIIAGVLAILIVVGGFIGFTLFNQTTSTPTPMLATVTDTNTSTPQRAVESTATFTIEPTSVVEPTSTPTTQGIAATATEPKEELVTPVMATDTPTTVPSRFTPTSTPSPSSVATNTPFPQPTNTPMATPTSQNKYQAPVLLAPIQGSTHSSRENVVLKWEPVSVLDQNEHYAIRIKYLSQSELKWDGDQIKSTEWLLPPEHLERVDGPEFKFEWYVFVERESNGKVERVSPDSETWIFHWERP